MEDNNKNNNLNVNINLDTTPILYTDHIQVNSSDDGVVIDFMQKLGPTNQFKIVSRIGMSREHAFKFYKIFGNSLKLSQGQLNTDKKTKN